MRIQFSTLSQDEQEQIHQAALSILERIGFRIKSLALFQLLHRTGLPCDESGQIVRFPRQAVIDALGIAPRQWVRTDQLGIPLPPPTVQPYFIARVLLNRVLDFGHQEPRPPNKQDLVNLIHLAHSLPAAHIIYKVDCPCSDIPPEMNSLETIATLYRTTTRHILANPINLESTRYYVELGEAATGRPVRGQAYLLCGIAATSPLTIDKDSGDSLAFLLQKGAPVNCFGMPISGASAPVTLAGTVVQHTAEVLGLITVTQVIAPDTPVGYGGMSTTMNLKTGDYCMAAPAVNLLSNATTSMARFYGLPAYNPANYTDSSLCDVQCGVEKALSTLAGVAAGSDVGMFGGDLHDAMTISYEQLLIDYDIWQTVLHLQKGIRVNPETMAQDAIEYIGHTGDWMTDPHTLSWLRSDEHFFGQFFVRGGQRTNRSMLQAAHARVVQILSETSQSPVSTEALERIDTYVRQEERLIQKCH